MTALTAATTTATAVSTSAAKAAAATLRFGPGLIDIERAAAEIGTVQRGDGAICFRGIRHFDECKAARPAGVAVRYQVHSFDTSVWFEERSNRRFRCSEIQIANKDVFHVVSCLSLTVRARQGREDFRAQFRRDYQKAS